MVPEGWSARKVLDCVTKTGRLPTVQRRAYLASGQVPVVDQGKGLVAGFTNNLDAAYPGRLPVILFGDHTREWKWLDFAFAAGADGTQILEPKDEFDARFLFYAFANIPLRNLGYSRHYKLLKEASFVHPPLPEQRKIAAILTAVDETIEKTEAVIEQLGIVKKAMMQELLTRGLPGRHTRFKKTEIGEIPEEWEVVRMVDVADVDYGISAAVSKNTNADIGWPILTGANITLRGTLDLSKLVYIAAPSKDSFKLQNNDLLLNWRSGSPQHVGKTALYDLGPGYTYASFVLRVRCRERWIPAFGHLLLNFMRDNEYFTRDLSQQVNFKMNAGVFREVKVLCPPLDEQAEIARRIAVIANRVAAERKLADQLRTTKSALMSVLLTGELRVSTEPG